MGNISNCIVTKFGPEALQTVQILSGAVVLYLLVLIYCKKEVNTVVKVAAAAVEYSWSSTACQTPSRLSWAGIF